MSGIQLLKIKIIFIKCIIKIIYLNILFAFYLNIFELFIKNFFGSQIK